MLDVEFSLLHDFDDMVQLVLLRVEAVAVRVLILHSFI